MKPELYIRRRFLKSSLAIPVLAHLTFKPAVAHSSWQIFLVPNAIQNELFKIYGNQASQIYTSQQLVLKAPDIAENGMVVNLQVEAVQGLVSSIAIFAEKNQHPLVSTCVLHRGVDLPVATRCKLAKTSDIYAIAQTPQGLVGVKKQVKVTIGCGGG